MAEEQFMKRAIELAKQGVGWTAPNPLVGAVVVKNGRVIGEGYHRKYGELHAERNALAACTEDPAGATLYVTLELAAITERRRLARRLSSKRKSPRWLSDLEIRIRRWRAKGLGFFGSTESTWWRTTCERPAMLESGVFHYITTKTPYVVLKFAMTLDGKIATRTGASKWITGEAARNHVHQLRGRYAGTGGHRHGAGGRPDAELPNRRSHQPLRIILDSHLRIPMGSRLVRSAKEYPLLIVCNESTGTGKKGQTEFRSWKKPGPRSGPFRRRTAIRI